MIASRGSLRPTIRVAAIIAGLALSGIAARAGTVSDSARYVHVVRVVRDDAADTVSVTLRIDPGFHVNANPASLPYLIPTTLKFAGVEPARIDYPAAILFKPKFADRAIAVYEGMVVISAFFPKGQTNKIGGVHATVTVQACTDAICLPPSALPVAMKAD